MKKHLLITLIALGLGLGLTLMVSTPSMAVHKGSGDLTCGNCHTMHSSQGGTSTPSMGGDTGSFILLRNPNVTSRSTIHNLCLQCHAENGSQAGVVMNTGTAATTPPKVYLTSIAWTESSDFTTIGAGGDFSYVGTYTGTFNLQGGDITVAVGRGHSLGITTPTPPGNNAGNSGAGTTLNSFSCTSCHDPHGTSSTTTSINRFRNLKAGAALDANAQRPINNMTSLSPMDIATSYVGGVNNGNNTLGSAPTVASNVWPVYRPSGSQNSYNVSSVAPTGMTLSDNSTYVSMSAFCAQCHGAWHEGFTGSTNKSTNDWARHPVDNRITDGSTTSGAGVTITDFAHYSNNTINPIGSKVPAANGAGAAVYYADNVGDKVFCLSCHFAHGSPYYDILRWNYIAAVDLGSQQGNGVASNRGCQQCHNR